MENKKAAQTFRSQQRRDNLKRSLKEKARADIVQRRLEASMRVLGEEDFTILREAVDLSEDPTMAVHALLLLTLRPDDFLSLSTTTALKELKESGYPVTEEVPIFGLGGGSSNAFVEAFVDFRDNLVVSVRGKKDKIAADFKKQEERERWLRRKERKEERERMAGRLREAQLGLDPGETLSDAISGLSPADAGRAGALMTMAVGGVEGEEDETHTPDSVSEDGDGGSVERAYRRWGNRVARDCRRLTFFRYLRIDREDLKKTPLPRGEDPEQDALRWSIHLALLLVLETDMGAPPSLDIKLWLEDRHVLPADSDMEREIAEMEKKKKDEEAFLKALEEAMVADEQDKVRAMLGVEDKWERTGGRPSGEWSDEGESQAMSKKGTEGAQKKFEVSDLIKYAEVDNKALDARRWEDRTLEVVRKMRIFFPEVNEMKDHFGGSVQKDDERYTERMTSDVFMPTALVFDLFRALRPPMEPRSLSGRLAFALSSMNTKLSVTPDDFTVTPSGNIVTCPGPDEEEDPHSALVTSSHAEARRSKNSNLHIKIEPPVALSVGKSTRKETRRPPDREPHPFEKPSPRETARYPDCWSLETWIRLPMTDEKTPHFLCWTDKNHAPICASADGGSLGGWRDVLEESPSRPERKREYEDEHVEEEHPADESSEFSTGAEAETQRRLLQKRQGLFLPNFSLSTQDPGWHHLVVVGRNSRQHFYFDGKPVGRISWMAMGSLVCIGNRLSKGDNPWGAFASLSVWKLSLRPQEVAIRYREAFEAVQQKEFASVWQKMLKPFVFGFRDALKIRTARCDYRVFFRRKSPEENLSKDDFDPKFPERYERAVSKIKTEAQRLYGATRTFASAVLLESPQMNDFRTLHTLPLPEAHIGLYRKQGFDDRFGPVILGSCAFAQYMLDKTDADLADRPLLCVGMNFPGPSYFLDASLLLDPPIKLSRFGQWTVTVWVRFPLLPLEGEAEEAKEKAKGKKKGGTKDVESPWRSLMSGIKGYHIGVGGDRQSLGWGRKVKAEKAKSWEKGEEGHWEHVPSGYEIGSAEAGWRHLAVTFGSPPGGGPAVTKFFVDAELVGQTAGGCKEDVVAIGNHRRGGRGFGMLCDFQLFSKMLEEVEVKELFTDSAGIFEAMTRTDVAK
eukprot:Cvel_15809.t1-p1 / transcript=Cvel_15809.t1 / gene=Cvel_15809 / organism=Chromera_velia_CCMP2878 / gene_product=hypothetical protein / transcript_product=hypothetical protein / location=Cvel_scaffold1187:25573-30311(-) / protein_length=1134 / sequence_SO=supercontig / SO=protein_coding / is_pseudo=false